MTQTKLDLPALDPATVPAVTGSRYPEPFKSRVSGRRKQRLGDALGLGNFGVNLTTIPPGAVSALRHWHTHEDEFIYIVSGELVLVTDGGEQALKPGMAAGFPAGKADGHCLVNRTGRDAVYLEVGDRRPEDAVTYPDDDIAGRATPQGRRFTKKDGTPFPA
ncbi:MAG: cupin domain-containing protein [Betaproteobacteria bacterium]|nr:cupin domain-containing protein [Betaproteobacteria bacterium]